MPQTAVEWLIEKQMDAGIGIPKEWREQAKEKEIEQRGYTKEDFLNAAELGEVSMIDARHIVSLLDEARSKIGNSDNSQTAVEWEYRAITAVEWLENELADKLKVIVLNKDYTLMEKIFEQAKAINKEQAIEHFISGSQWSIFPDDTPIDKIAEQYYNEYYKN